MLFIFNGRRVISISASLICSKTLMELTFNPCGYFGEVRRAQLAKSLSSPPRWGPCDLSVTLRSVEMLKRMGCGKQRDATAPVYTL